MPLYAYRCPDCGQEFELMCRYSEANLRPECPACGSENSRKLISVPAAMGSSGTSASAISGGGCGTGGGFT